MIKRIKNKILNFILSKSQKISRNRSIKPISQIKKVGILIGNTEDVDLICSNIEKEFKKYDINKTSFVKIEEKKSTLNPKGENLITIPKKDIKIKGHTTNTELKKFTEQEFDLLIDLSKGEEPALNYILLNSKANCKVAKSNNFNEDNYDLLINLTQDSHSVKDDNENNIFTKQLINFLASIKN